jgi:hypothetical protein
MQSLLLLFNRELMRLTFSRIIDGGIKKCAQNSSCQFWKFRSHLEFSAGISFKSIVQRKILKNKNDRFQKKIIFDTRLPTLSHV